MNEKLNSLNIVHQVRRFVFQTTAQIGKAVSSPKRLELLDLLCHGEKSVEILANTLGLNIKITSAHLKALKGAGLVESRRAGKYVFYGLANSDVATFWIHLRTLSEKRLTSSRAGGLSGLQEYMDYRNQLSSSQSLDREALLLRAHAGEVVVIDVRPKDEYESGHLPHALSIPLAQLSQMLSTLPKERPIVAYCRGPYCHLADQAVKMLERHGFEASQFSDGVAEWEAAGLPIERGSEARRRV